MTDTTTPNPHEDPARDDMEKADGRPQAPKTDPNAPEPTAAEREAMRIADEKARNPEEPDHDLGSPLSPAEAAEQNPDLIQPSTAQRADAAARRQQDAAAARQQDDDKRDSG